MFELKCVTIGNNYSNDRWIIPQDEEIIYHLMPKRTRILLLRILCVLRTTEKSCYQHLCIEIVFEWEVREGEGGGGGGKSSFTPTKGGRGAEKVVAMLGGGGGGGGTSSFEVVLTQELEVLAILIGGGRKKCPPFKRWEGGGVVKSFPLSWVGRGQKVLDLRYSHFVGPPPYKWPVPNALRKQTC